MDGGFVAAAAVLTLYLPMFSKQVFPLMCSTFNTGGAWCRRNELDLQMFRDMPF